MSNFWGAPKQPDASRSVARGDTIGTCSSYLDTQKAVDYLADRQFQVRLVPIVGDGLKMVERATARLSYPGVALSGALTGMWCGIFCRCAALVLFLQRRLCFHRDLRPDGCSLLHALRNRELCTAAGKTGLRLHWRGARIRPRRHHCPADGRGSTPHASTAAMSRPLACPTPGGCRLFPKTGPEPRRATEQANPNWTSFPSTQPDTQEERCPRFKVHGPGRRQVTV